MTALQDFITAIEDDEVVKNYFKKFIGAVSQLERKNDMAESLVKEDADSLKKIIEICNERIARHQTQLSISEFSPRRILDELVSHLMTVDDSSEAGYAPNSPPTSPSGGPVRRKIRKKTSEAKKKAILNIPMLPSEYHFVEQPQTVRINEKEFTIPSTFERRFDEYDHQKYIQEYAKDEAGFWVVRKDGRDYRVHLFTKVRCCKGNLKHLKEPCLFVEAGSNNNFNNHWKTVHPGEIRPSTSYVTKIMTWTDFRQLQDDFAGVNRLERQLRRLNEQNRD